MKKIFKTIAMICIFATIFIAGCSNNSKPSAAENQPMIIKDMAGREIKIDKEIKKIFGTSPAGSIMLYSLAPDKLIGWNVKLTEEEKAFIPDKYKNLPVLGGWMGKNATGNAEAILKEEPDLIVHASEINDKEISTATRIQEQLGIPVIIVDTSIINSDKAYKFLGEVIEEEAKAEELMSYCRKTLDGAKELTEKIPQEERVRVYYAQGIKGLESEPKDSVRSEILNIAGGENVISSSPNKSSYGHSQISLEQLIALNPEVILTRGNIENGKINSPYNMILNDSNWKSIEAVKNKRVYEVPQVPFNWFDRPTSVNRIIGIKWLSNLLYEDMANINIKEEVKEFYKIFYHYDLTNKELNEIMVNSK
ncbi:ABC transporter substrate-binding protein [Clostridium sp. MSJ-11]|uniref:ABC transporter substrate-binding protein n=1 Tax=Clostridium mobile TaxID=2841512 RepID=A0ABS6EHW0_9CLOT|nr:ABC transporter substrate-binding protein [Clostridium mobile]MBU5484722.1 ABC transporter substrate-binding protein [Clostridium mobile]